MQTSRQPSSVKNFKIPRTTNGKYVSPEMFSSLKRSFLAPICVNNLSRFTGEQEKKYKIIFSTMMSDRERNTFVNETPNFILPNKEQSSVKKVGKNSIFEIVSTDRLNFMNDYKKAYFKKNSEQVKRILSPQKNEISLKVGSEEVVLFEKYETKKINIDFDYEKSSILLICILKSNQFVICSLYH